MPTQHEDPVVKIAASIIEAVRAQLDDGGPAMSISAFCRNNDISPSHYYNLPPEDRPEVMWIGRVPRISPRAQAEWRRRMEAKKQEARAAS